MQKCLSKLFKVFYKMKTKNKRVAEEKLTEIIPNIMVSVKICVSIY